MHTASLPADHYDDALARLPPGIDLTGLAFETGAIERRREIEDGAGLLRMALARGPGGLSLIQTAAWAGMIGLSELSSVGVKDRVDKAADFLDALVSRLLAEAAEGRPVHWPGRSLRNGPTIGVSAITRADFSPPILLDIGPVEDPETVPWIDPIHKEVR